MYKSLLSWCRFDIYIQKYTGTTASGDSGYNAAAAYKGYPVATTVEITDRYGERYISRSQIYFPASVSIAPEDLISLDNVTSFEIRKLGGFYNGNTGSLDIQVVYL